MDMSSLVPASDIIPVHWAWFKILLITTFTAHILLMNIMLGSAIIAFISSINSQSDSSLIYLEKEISQKNTFIIAFTINFGVAPLLFLQVLYGNLFYTSSILMAVYWMSVIFLLITAYYSAYIYKFNFESMNIRTTIESKIPGYSEITEKIAVGFLYSTELNASWFDGALQLGINNQRRAWGNDYDNLTLSASARKFPAFEFKLAPLKWLRYSYLLGSLHSGKSLFGAYKSEIYGYDVGALQNNFTLHMLEVEPWDWFLITATAGNVWVKRFEINYMIPFVFSHLSELESGDYDNLTMSLDFTFKVPNFGKIWFSFFNDEFSFIEKGNLLKMPRNRYAWQLGFVNRMSFLPQTLSSFKYSRVTPFAYTHYPETRLSNFNNRPYDMTYSNDGFNLGFYLPPNSGEFNWTLTNFAVNNLTLTMENRFIMHGTNDLASEELKLIYGDIYRHQYTNSGEDIHQYPLLDFTKDGIYDFTLSSEIRFDYRIRKSPFLDYYRLFGTIGAARTWWKENSSGVTAPAPRNFATISFGVAIDI